MTKRSRKYRRRIYKYGRALLNVCIAYHFWCVYFRLLNYLDSLKTYIGHKMYVSFFSATFFSENVSAHVYPGILDMFINECSSIREVSVIVFDLTEDVISPRNFSKPLQCRLSWKSRPYLLSCCVWTGTKTDKAKLRGKFLQLSGENASKTGLKRAERCVEDSVQLIHVNVCY